MTDVPRPTASTGAPTSASLLEVRALNVVYGAVSAVQDLSLTVAAGSAVAILGANGAGKSSVLRTIGGLQTPKSGEIWFAGARADGLPAETLVRRGIAMVTDSRDLFPRFTVEANLKMGALRLPSREWSASRDRVLDLFPPLRRLLGRSAWTLS
ncbi:MAG: branched-chain amino acid transport system ATP-binding protein, partial [Chloroflexi bacterium]|nr:branched-chain amino acid transport system ATP-binding protein [Chloroflexota bacterium]